MSNYKTSDTPLAAYLIYIGYPLTNIKKTNNKFYFYFDNSTNGLSEAVFAFESGNAQGNIPVYFEAYMRLIRIIRTENDRI